MLTIGGALPAKKIAFRSLLHSSADDRPSPSSLGHANRGWGPNSAGHFPLLYLPCLLISCSLAVIRSNFRVSPVEVNTAESLSKLLFAVIFLLIPQITSTSLLASGRMTSSAFSGREPSLFWKHWLESRPRAPHTHVIDTRAIFWGLQRSRNPSFPGQWQRRRDNRRKVLGIGSPRCPFFG